MPGRHLPPRHKNPRHKAPRSLRRSVGRLAEEVVGSVPAAKVTGAVAVVGAAGVAVGVGVVAVDTQADASESGSSTISASAAAVGDDTRLNREARDGVSRSSSRPSLASTKPAADKAKHLPVAGHGVQGAVTKTVQPTDPRKIAAAMLPAYGWSDQFSCLDALWISESAWDPSATNPTSGAYGIPQSLPADKMASAGSDWRTNPATQIEWGLKYIQLSYGTPCNAWSFKQANNWY